MFRRVLRLTVKLGVIAAIGVGIAMVVKKFTQTPDLPAAPLEPWPPLATDDAASTATDSADAGNGSSAADAPAGEDANEAAPSAN